MKIFHFFRVSISSEYPVNFTGINIEGTNRQQLVLFLRSLAEIMDPNNEVRIPDRFVNTLDLK